MSRDGQKGQRGDVLASLIGFTGSVARVSQGITSGDDEAWLVEFSRLHSEDKVVDGDNHESAAENARR
jgi:hypothetical protein